MSADTSAAMRQPMPLLLTVNGGSSSTKCALFTLDATSAPVWTATVNGIGTAAARLAITDAGGTGVIVLGAAGATHAAAAHAIIAALGRHPGTAPLAGIAHRVVHGGERFDRAQRVGSDTLEHLRQLIPLAPNHLPDEIALIELFQRARPDTPQVVCFDTAFHRGLPLVSRTLPVPDTPGLRRYGFHGLSYAYLLGELERVAGLSAARGRVVLAHLGSGASLAAVANGQCADTSMAVTPLGGVVMSSRSGDLDPGVVTYLARQRNLSPDQLDHLLAYESGLRAISGRSGDMEDLLAQESADSRARLAIDVFCYQVRKWIGAFAAALGGLDTLVFSGGIGEHAPVIRSRICSDLSFLGVRLAEEQNAAGAPVISTPAAGVRVCVIATNEAVMMAREARSVLMESLT